MTREGRRLRPDASCWIACGHWPRADRGQDMVESPEVKQRAANPGVGEVNCEGDTDVITNDTGLNYPVRNGFLAGTKGTSEEHYLASEGILSMRGMRQRMVCGR